jgi:putative ABC transport system permease protein
MVRRSIDALSRNVGYALRVLARTPGLTLTVVLTLALGIGASSAVFTAVNAVLLEPLPYPDADRLVSVRQTQARATVANVGPVRLEEWNERNSTFEALMGYTTQNAADTSADVPESIRVAGVSPRMIEVWGIAPILGRGFVAADHEAGAAPVAMIAESLWERRFNRDPNVIGKIISSGDQTAEIVGVMPATFAFPDPEVEVWGATIYFGFVLNRRNAWYTSFGRLRSGVTVEQAQADLRRVQAELAEEYPDTDRELSVDLVPLKTSKVGSVRGSLWLLFGAVSVLLLIACTNIASLLLARVAEQQPQLAVRLALGASRRAIAAQMLTETAMLAVVGAGLGMLVATGVTTSFRALAPNFPRLDDITLSGTTLVFTAALVVGVTLLCGLAPAIHTRGTNARTILELGRAQIARRHSLHWAFVGVQVALSVALLAGAGLLIRSFHELSRVDTGFDPTNVLTFRITGSFAESYESQVQGVERMLEELAALPGVEGTASSSPVPGVLNDGSGFQFGATEWQLADGRDPDIRRVAEVRVVSPSYFATMEIPLLAGETCRRQAGDGIREMVVNQAFASRYLAGHSPIGLLMRAPGGTASRIVGIAGDARDFGLDREPVPTTYNCATTASYPPLALLVRTTNDPMTMVNTVRQRLAEIEPQRSIYGVMPLEQRIGNEYSADRLRTVVTAIFAGAALLLVSLGMYGTLSYVVSLRRREIGLRVALGALQSVITSHFLVKAMRVVGIACVAGLALAFAVSRSLSTMLYGVSPTDPATLAGVIVIVLVVAATAALVPAVRASRVDPITALREE